MRKILITGGAGYIGSVLTRKLLERGYFVRVFDILYYGEESLIELYGNSNFEFIKGDIRKKTDVKKAISGMDAVVHLAAIVGDPACFRKPKLANETNWKGSKLLYDLCSEDEHIRQFIFASTCSNYGRMEGDGYVNEESILRPISLYAKLKVKFEQYLHSAEPKNGLIVTTLRFSTVYGLSPRMRFDLTVNEFILKVTLSKELTVYGEQFWRPYCHVEDSARACIIVLESERGKVDKNVFGVGDTSENYQKKMIVDELYKIVPDAKIKYVHKDEDPRDYKVGFEKIKNKLGFRIQKTVPDGLKEIHEALENKLI